MNEFYADEVNELMRKLAYEFWEQRGRPVGSADVDWQRAEERLRSYGFGSLVGPPLSGFAMGPSE